jgi:hypothetical protein
MAEVTGIDLIDPRGSLISINGQAAVWAIEGRTCRLRELAMAYKTVLVHCNDRGRLSQVAEAAARVAAQFEAHLVALSVTPPVYVAPTGMPGTPDTLVIADRLVLGSGRPVLIVPKEAPVREVGRRMLWAGVAAGKRHAPPLMRCRPAKRRIGSTSSGSILSSRAGLRGTCPRQRCERLWRVMADLLVMGC